jgi:hypothetical protein
MPRKGSKAEKRAALDGSLKGMFKSLEGRPTPERIRTLVDQLEDPPTELSSKKKAGR